MKTFQLRYDDWDLYGSTMFNHETKTKEEFEADVKNIATGDLSSISTDNEYISFTMIFDYIVEELIKLGYVYTDIESVDVPYGDFNSPWHKEKNNRFGTFVGKENYQNFYNKNKEFLKKIN